MTEQPRNQYFPDAVSAPGETLEEVLVSRGMSQAELADRTGRPKKTINEIVKGKASITAETALQFERVLGIPASFWMAREQNYREALARAKDFQLFERGSEWLDKIPYRAMTKLGWVKEHREKVRQVEELLQFFGVASPTTWDEIWGESVAAFRQSPTFRSERGAVAAWLRRGEIEAAQLICEEYDEHAFRVALTYIKSLTRELPKDFTSKVQNVCKPCGVAVVFIPELPGTTAWGATRWLSATRALIQLSLRYKTDDHLWFTFFHEAAHILLHGKRETFVEDDSKEQSDKEREADSFARDWLIPAFEYKAFCRRGSFSCAAASRFAFEIGVAPGIVVGRLQYDGYVRRDRCNELKKNVEWVFDIG